MLVHSWNALGPNPNVSWYSKKRVWAFYLLCIALLRFGLVLFHIRPPIAWTLTHIIHSAISFFILHWTKGSPFPHDNTKKDKLTIWEQIDNEKQYTPTKKVFTAIPIILFLIAIHENEYGALEFFWNVVSLAVVLFPKTPAFHRVRLFGINED
eukprot:TRINITY_DN24100_c0_g1_i1.p1 TRINITY_DN24100_c0_g1~~TRINITY_DN24100_c0_g1_i1.p1  ORF type:complete len:153 (-),score=23.35 TRINITY_DN24100_c0_g1_i1:75-533(-)